MQPIAYQRKSMSEQQQMVGDPVSTPIQTETKKVEETKTEEKKPLYQGMAGAIESQEELTAYTKNLEEMLVLEKARAMEKKPDPQPFNQSVSSPIPEMDEEQRITKEINDVWYSDPAKALELIDRRNELKLNKSKAQEEYIKNFWDEFYGKNPDLKDNANTVQLVLTAKKAIVDRMQTKEEVEKFLSVESRKIIEPIKNKYVAKETPLESRAAVSFGASGEPVRTPPTPDVSQPKTLADQVLQLSRARRKK